MPVTEYCLLADVTKLGIAAPALRNIPDPDIADAIKTASSIMDSYLRKQFALPLLTAGQDLRECCAVLSAWTAVGTRRLGPDEDVEGNVLYIRYKGFIKWLEMVATGEVTPSVTDAESESESGSDTVALGAVISNVSRGWQSEDIADSGRPFTGTRS